MEVTSYSDKQIKIFSEIQNGTGNVAVKATAGSGKTTTIVHACKLIPRSKKGIFLCFNRSIKEELATKVPPHMPAFTLHGLGMKMIRTYYDDKYIIVDADKYFKLAIGYWKKHILAKGEAYLSKKDYGACKRIEQIVQFARMTLVDFEDKESLSDMCNYYSVEYEDQTIEISQILLRKALDTPPKMIIDFTDMIYFPVMISGIVDRQYDVVFLDEAQDTNKCQFALLEKIISKKGRLISVGDDFQCQPSGTQVLLNNGRHKEIEKLKVGDIVVTYDCAGGRGFIENKLSKSTCGTVNKIQKRIYKGDLIKVFTGDETSYYSPEHICYAKFNPKYYNTCSIVYVMQQGDRFRIGHMPLRGKNSHQATVSIRLAAEKAEKMWILNIYETKREAYIEEQFYSFQFGIPQLRFQDNCSGLYDQDELDRLWNRFDKKILFNRVNDLLKYFNRQYNCPIFEKGKGKHYISCEHISTYAACNLIPKFMELGIYGENITKTKTYRANRIIYKELKSLESQYYEGYLYSIDIERYHNYVADNILTHNCIYGFSGADTDAFKRIRERPNTITLPLSTSYRCPKQVVKKAQDVNPEIEAHEEAIEGEVRDGYLDEIEEGDMVLSRTTRPLIALYFELIDRDIKATVVGKEFENGLIDFASKVMRSTKEEMLAKIDAMFKELASTLQELGVKSFVEHPKWRLLDEKYQIIKILFKKVDHTSQLIPTIERIFNEDKYAVKLMTIHRSKGLECERVFIILEHEGQKLMPSKFASQPWEHTQEINLQFVATTRARNQLIFLKLNQI